MGSKVVFPKLGFDVSVFAGVFALRPAVFEVV